MTTDALSISSSLNASARGPALSPASDPGQRLASAQHLFASTLNKAREQTPESQEAAVRKTAEELVAITMVQPVLAQLRETNNAAAPFGPTQAEKQFGALQDARVAQDIVRGSKFPIVDQIAQQMLNRLGQGAPTPDSQGGRHDSHAASQPSA